MEQLIQWAVDGTLADAVELFYHVQKASDDEGVTSDAAESDGEYLRGEEAN